MRKGKRIILWVMIACLVLVFAGCGEEEPKVDPSSVEKHDLTNVSELGSLSKGKYYVFDAVFWTTSSNKYSYVFNCYLEGEEHANAFHVKDATGGDMDFLKKYSFQDKKEVRITAEFVETEKTEKQTIYKFKCIEIKEK